VFFFIKKIVVDNLTKFERFNPIPSGVLENQILWGGGAINPKIDVQI